jgi:phosphomannomutase
MAKGGKISPETEFKKGQSGNPNGRPKKLPSIDLLMAEVMGEEKDGITAAQAILNMLRGKAAKGDIKAAQLLLERAYGKSKQNIDITTQGEKVTVPTIIFTKDGDKG